MPGREFAHDEEYLGHILPDDEQAGRQARQTERRGRVIAAGRRAGL
jgi:hypothetical protein